MCSDEMKTPVESVPLPPTPAETRLLVAAFSRVKVSALGISAAVVTGLCLFMATALLLLAALIAPTGHPVGPTLGRLSNYLPGYDVTWFGAVVALLYGLVIGFAIGAILGWMLNLSHAVYIRVVLRRLRGGVIDGAL